MNNSKMPSEIQTDGGQIIETDNMGRDKLWEINND